MIPRRLLFTVSAAALVAGPGLLCPARAQSASDAAAFVKATGVDLVQVVNSNGSPDQKAQALAQVIDSRVDVNGIAKFCLGRFWRTATQQQQQQFLDLFHRVLVLSIDSKMGEYKGVTFTIGRTVSREDGQVVSTVIKRPVAGSGQRGLGGSAGERDAQDCGCGGGWDVDAADAAQRLCLVHRA